MKTFFFALIGILFVSVIPNIHAETTHGPNYDDTVLGHDANGFEIHRWEAHPQRISLPNGTYADYILTQNSTTILVETANSGSFAFKKSSCSYNLYNSGLIAWQEHPSINDISYTVKGKANSSSIWTSINTVNSATCVSMINQTGTGISVTGTKTNGAGSFQIKLDYFPGKGIKETLRAYNNNPAWTNHNIGFTEKFQVPQTIKLGNTQYDLSQYNNTVLDRNWIINNKASLLRLTDKINYDFGLGWNNLQDIKITWINYKAYLSLNYLYGGYIVPYQQWIEVDPTFGPSADTSYLVETSNAGAGACTTATTWAKSAATGRAEIQSNADPADPTCHRAIAAWDITTLPVTAVVIDSDASFTSSAPVNMGARSCSSYRVMNNPATASAGTLWNDAGDGAKYVNSDTNCRTASTYSLDLGTTADSNIQASRAAGNTTFAISVKLEDETKDGSGHSTSFINNAITLTIVYISAKPDAVTTLHSTSISTTSVDLAWTAPNMNGGTCSGYQINYTTPWGQPITILNNNTGVCTTSYTVSPLVIATDYSFRVSARTQLGVNATGNILNITTLAFNAANYTIGSFNFNANNPLIFPIRYERINNGTSTYVNVTFSNTINLACDLRYTYAGTNHTYHTIPSIPTSATEKEAQFRFTNSSKDITTFHCWNQSGNQSANYVLTQNDFLLKQQVRDFRNGTYGTMGQFGAFDFISLVVVIITMIGLNRNNEAVAAVFLMFGVAALAFFSIVDWSTVIVSGIIVITIFAIASTRKD